MKTYKVITVFEIGVMYIEHFNTLKTAKDVFKQAIKDEAETVYLTEEELHWSGSGDSEDKVLATYKNKNK